MTTTRHQAHSQKQSTSGKFYPDLKNLPPLPKINWEAISDEPPKLLHTSHDYLPPADAVVITWVESEWAAMEHVFVQSDEEMPYSAASTGHWDGWQKYNKDMPYYPSQENWDYWGYYRLVEIHNQEVLLFKSNTHLDWPGQRYLEDLIYRFIDYVKPKLILSIGTAGGSRLDDHLGAVNVVNAGTFYEKREPRSDWPNYANKYSPNWRIISESDFNGLLFAIPATEANLQTLADQFNKHYGTDYPLSQLNVDGLDNPTAVPALSNLTPEGTPLLTASTFVVGTTSGEYADFACIEMDDAVIGKVCAKKGLAFGFVRNISDPAQNAALPSDVQRNWGSAVYEVFGFYTSYNGALATWAMLAGQES